MSHWICPHKIMTSEIAWFSENFDGNFNLSPLLRFVGRQRERAPWPSTMTPGLYYRCFRLQGVWHKVKLVASLKTQLLERFVRAAREREREREREKKRERERETKRQRENIHARNTLGILPEQSWVFRVVRISPAFSCRLKTSRFQLKWRVSS